MKKLNCLGMACVLGFLVSLSFTGAPRIPIIQNWLDVLPFNIAFLLNVAVVIVILYGLLFLALTFFEERIGKRAAPIERRYE